MSALDLPFKLWSQSVGAMLEGCSAALLASATVADGTARMLGPHAMFPAWPAGGFGLPAMMPVASNPWAIWLDPFRATSAIAWWQAVQTFAASGATPAASIGAWAAPGWPLANPAVSPIDAAVRMAGHQINALEQLSSTWMRAWTSAGAEAVETCGQRSRPPAADPFATYRSDGGHAVAQIIFPDDTRFTVSIPASALAWFAPAAWPLALISR